MSSSIVTDELVREIRERIKREYVPDIQADLAKRGLEISRGYIHAIGHRIRRKDVV